jgi:hypothetical protein
MSRRVIATAIAVAFVISALAMPTVGAAASELRAPVLSLDSFTTNKVVGTDGSVSYTFDFSASWTRAQDANFYLLCVINLELAQTCWAFTSKGYPDRPGGGDVTLSFSATNIPVGYLILPEGPVLITHLPFLRNGMLADPRVRVQQRGDWGCGHDLTAAFRDASAARAAIERTIAEGKRFSGKTLKEGILVRYTAGRLRSLGSGVLEHVRARPTGGGTDRFQTNVTFRVGQLRGNVIVSRGDRTNTDRLALDLARQLQRRIITTLRHG